MTAGRDYLCPAKAGTSEGNPAHRFDFLGSQSLVTHAYLTDQTPQFWKRNGWQRQGHDVSTIENGRKNRYLRRRKPHRLVGRKRCGFPFSLCANDRRFIETPRRWITIGPFHFETPIGSNQVQVRELGHAPPHVGFPVIFE